MPKTVIVTIETAPTPFPAGTAAAGIVVTLSGLPSQTIAAAPYAATFTEVPPGDYTATAQAVDHAGQPIGAAAVSAQFSIVADPVNIDIPTLVTVAVQ